MKAEDFVEYTIKIHKDDVKEYLALDYKVIKCLMNETDLKYKDLLALEDIKQKWKQYYSAEDEKKIATLINYFKKQKGFYFEPSKDTVADDTVLNEYKRRNKVKNNIYYNYYDIFEMNFERNIRILYSTANRYGFKDDKEYQKRLMKVICYLPFPKKYSLSKKKVIAGYIAAQYGLLEAEGNEPDGYPTYHKYLSDLMKYYVPDFDDVMANFLPDRSKKDYSFLWNKRKKK